MKENRETASIAEIQAIAEEAYISAYPMLENYKTMERTVGPSAEKNRKFNTLKSTSKLLGPEFTNIVAPNNDTVYSSAWLDLADGPQILSVPEIQDHRYWVFQMIDMFNFNFGYVGARSVGYESSCYLISGPDWKGEVPSTCKKSFRSETRFAFLIGRTLMDGPEDIENVKVIQSGYKLESLKQHLGENEMEASGQVPGLLPYDIEKARSASFISYFNFILGNAVIHPHDEERIRRFSKIGIVPGRTFSIDQNPDETTDSIERGVRRAENKIKRKVKDIGFKVNGWNTLVDSHGPREVMAKNPLLNAAGAMAALYGNDKEEASNFVGYFDSDGRELNTAKYNYSIRFEKDSFPPVLAFWSITMYRLPEILLVANPINRYSIGDRTRNLRYGEDGSLEIYFQELSPGQDKESNWLPGPQGPFIVALRNYWPDEALFSDFKPPFIFRAPRAEAT